MSVKNVPKLGPNSIFSDEEKAKRLIECYNSGMKWKEIEERLGVSHGVCYNALKALGVLQDGGNRNRRLNKRKTEILVKSYQEGRTIEELEKDFNITREKCCSILRAHGVLRGYGQLFNCISTFESLKKDYEDGMLWKDIAKKYGVKAETCRRYLNEAGVIKKRKRTIVLSDEKKKKCIKDYESNMPINAIAVKYDLPIPRVYQILKDEGICIRKRKNAEGIFENKEELDAIIRCYRDGYLLIDMAKKFKLDRKTIVKVLKLANEPVQKNRKEYSREDKKQMKHLYLECKHSIKEIACAFNSSEYCVARSLKLRGVELREEEEKEFSFVTKKITEEEKKEILRLMAQNFSVSEIAKTLNLTYWQVKGICR